MVGGGDPDTDENGRVLCGLPGLSAVSESVDLLKHGAARCGRVTCPVCYPHWRRVRAFEIAVKVEVMARINGERPSVVEASLPASVSATLTDRERQTRVRRRGIRRVKSMGATGGVAFRHNWRLTAHAKRELRERGYGGWQTEPDQDGRGYWRGARDDVCEWGGWWAYVKPGDHDHYIVDRAWLKSHTRRDFVVKKYAVLDTLADVVYHTMYLLSHTTVREYAPDHATHCFGSVYELDLTMTTLKGVVSFDDLTAIEVEAARLVGMVWNVEKQRLEYPVKELPEGALVEAPEPEWVYVGELHRRMTSEYFRGWREGLPDDRLDFIVKVIGSVRGEGPPDRRMGRLLLVEDVDEHIPAGVEWWGPPESHQITLIDDDDGPGIEPPEPERRVVDWDEAFEGMCVVRRGGAP